MYAKIEKSFTDDLKKLLRENPKLASKVKHLIDKIVESPRSGIAHPEQLKGCKPRIVWSRHITEKHRLVYEINDKDQAVIFTDCYGHYKDH
jgi:toxin YoeB